MKKTIICLILALALLPFTQAGAQTRPPVNWYEVFVYSYAVSYTHLKLPTIYSV